MEEVATMFHPEHQDLLYEFYYFMSLMRVQWRVRGSRFISKLVRRDHETPH
jgi:hypothetical protein